MNIRLFKQCVVVMSVLAMPFSAFSFVPQKPTYKAEQVLDELVQKAGEYYDSCCVSFPDTNWKEKVPARYYLEDDMVTINGQQKKYKDLTKEEKKQVNIGEKLEEALKELSAPYSYSSYYLGNLVQDLYVLAYCAAKVQLQFVDKRTWKTVLKDLQVKTKLDAFKTAIKKADSKPIEESLENLRCLLAKLTRRVSQGENPLYLKNGKLNVRRWLRSEIKEAIVNVVGTSILLPVGGLVIHSLLKNAAPKDKVLLHVRNNWFRRKSMVINGRKSMVIDIVYE